MLPGIPASFKFLMIAFVAYTVGMLVTIPLRTSLLHGCEFILTLVSSFSAYGVWHEFPGNSLLCQCPSDAYTVFAPCVAWEPV